MLYTVKQWETEEIKLIQNLQPTKKLVEMDIKTKVYLTKNI